MPLLAIVYYVMHNVAMFGSCLLSSGGKINNNCTD